MIKTIISLLVLVLAVTSCSNEKDLWLDIEIKKPSLETTQEETIKEDVRDENIQINENNTKVDLEEVKTYKNNKKLIVKDYNIFIREEGKEDIVLTTKASGHTECKYDDNMNLIWAYKEDGIPWIITYEIINEEWKFWLIEKFFNNCWWGGKITYYAINLENELDQDSVVTEIKNLPFWWDYYSEVSVHNEDLILKIMSDYVVKEISNRWEILLNEVKNSWFSKEWDFWVKSIDLNQIDPDKE